VAAVSFASVGKTFRNGTRAVDDLSLDVRDGELMVVVGPSGSGKTTALRMLAGLEDVSEGEIRIDGEVVNDIEPQDRDVAMVFQNYALYPHMSIYDNIAFGLKVRKTPKGEIDRRVRDVARVLGLEGLIASRPRQLSAGQRQRVAMGRAIVRHPAVFLMDEPLSNLDARLRVQMRGEIARIQHELDATTIYVTHDQVEAMTMGDRVAVLHRGRLEQVDIPERLYESPDNVFVASFIGSPAMNLVQARLERRDGLVAYVGDQALELPEKVAVDHPALHGYEGGAVVLGIRPEHVEAVPPGAANGAPRLRGQVLLTGALGAEQLVHVDVDAPPVATGDVLDMARAAGAFTDEELAAERTQFVVRFDPGFARAGELVEFAVRPEKLHFFDVETGRAIS
jgi:multiple sugar transport system ATP-binding protein